MMESSNIWKIMFSQQKKASVQNLGSAYCHVYWDIVCSELATTVRLIKLLQIFFPGFFTVRISLLMLHFHACHCPLTVHLCDLGQTSFPSDHSLLDLWQS